MEKKIIVAVDGYSSSGKSTMARELAKRIGYIYVDSGAMYRAVTLYALEHEMFGSDGKLDVKALEAALPQIDISFAPAGNDGVQHTLLNGRDVEKEIRSMEVSGKVSPVSEISAVRRRLTALQQSYGVKKGIVMDGRDIGTTVFPDAEMKVFVNASPEVRARRRLLELEQKGVKADYENVLNNIRERDRIDSSRADSPLRKADDAYMLENDNHTVESQMQWMLDLFNKITGGK